MFVDRPQNPNGLLVVCDVRLRHDRNLEAKEGGNPVLRHWPFGVACLGKTEWARTTRVALYDYGEKVTSKIKHERQAELLEFLASAPWPCALVMQTRSSEQKSKDDFGDAQGLVGTHCWAAIKAPDRLPDMAGCIWAAPWGPTIGLLNPVNYEYVYRELIRRHMRLGLAVAEDKRGRKIEDVPKFPLRPKSISWDRSNATDAMLLRLAVRAEAGTPIAVDIESASELNLITALGFSDGVEAVSIPVEAFPIFGTDQIEPAGKPLVLERAQRILSAPCSKLFHNYSYDVPFLQAKGFRVDGSVHDTMAMHVCVYKQWPHGLQRACAQELPVPPWKSLHRPQFAKRLKLTKKDMGWWTCEPLGNRFYNCNDAFYTWHLGRGLAPKVGIRL